MNTKRAHSLFETIKPYALIVCMFVLGTVVAMGCNIPVKRVMSGYSYDVLVILIVMELFTNLIAETGIMQSVAVSIAKISGGRKKLLVMLFGLLMFFISSCLNNITAVMIILPVMTVLLKTLEIDRKYVNLFFGCILALSNLGGMASPVGDFPAILLLSSGITTFVGYLTHAFPLAFITAVVVTIVWSVVAKGENDDGAIRKLAVLTLGSQYKHNKVRMDALLWLAVVFVGMFAAWSFIPQEILPPEMVAVLGYCTAMIIAAVKGIDIKQSVDMKSVLTIGSFLFFAAVISETGILNLVADFLQRNIANPKLLVLAIMLITSLVAGVFSAGPAAAAMLPIVVNLCNGPFAAQSDWITVAYAAAICAGSSLFMWSATAGFILSGNVNESHLVSEKNEYLTWGIGEYLKYGIANYAIQMAISIIVVVLVL